MAHPILRITDGDNFVDLLALKGWLLKDWNPSVAEPKGGGVFRSNPLVDGRKLAYRTMDNITDTFNLVGSGGSQNEMIHSIQQLQRILESAIEYWTSHWNSKIVWMEARGPLETYERYATIIDYRLTGFGNPYKQPLFGCSNSATEALLVIEHEFWQETPPGAYGKCVPLKSKTNYPSTLGFATADFNPAHSLADISYSNALTSCITNNHELFVGYTDKYKGLFNSGIVFETVNIDHLPYPYTDSAIKKAILKLYVVDYSGTGDSVDIRVRGQKEENGRINSITLVTAGKNYDPARTQVQIFGGGVGAKIVATVGSATAKEIADLTLVDGGSGYVNPTLKITDCPMPPFPPSCGSGATATCTATAIGGSAALFTGENADYLDRPRTETSVDFTIPLSTMFGTGEIQVDVTNIIREIIDNDNWVSGNHICLFIELLWQGGTSPLDYGVTFESFDEGGANPPELSIDYATALIPAGRDTTCSPEVYVTNKHNTAPVNFIVCYDASAADKYSTNMFEWDYAIANMPLFQDINGAAITPAVGDILYFGSCPVFAGDKNYGPFNNLVYDLMDIDPDISGKWSYWNGGWTDYDDVDLNNLICGDHLAFGRAGVISDEWQQPNDWTTCGVTVKNVGVVTGYWMRFEVTGVGANPLTPYQQHRNIYTILNPYIDINSEYVPGDIPALAKINFAIACCSRRPMNDLVMGLRSLSRGEQFDAYLNASIYQRPDGIVCQILRYAADGTDTCAFLTLTDAPTGQVIDLSTYDPNTNSITDLLSVCQWAFDTHLSPQYIGTYHAYVRCRFPSADAVGRVKFRLVTHVGNSYNLSYSEINTVASDDFHCIDLGQVSVLPFNVSTLRPTSPKYLRPSDKIGQLVIELQCYGDNETYPAIFTNAYIYDVVLIPSDEWTGNFGMPETDINTSHNNGVIVDSISTPKQYRAMQYYENYGDFNDRRGATKTLSAEWAVIASGKPIFQANADQRLWFLQYYHASDGVMYSYFENAGAICAERSSRYLLMRGDE